MVALEPLPAPPRPGGTFRPAVSAAAVLVLGLTALAMCTSTPHLPRVGQLGPLAVRWQQVRVAHLRPPWTLRAVEAQGTRLISQPSPSSFRQGMWSLLVQELLYESDFVPQAVLAARLHARHRALVAEADAGQVGAVDFHIPVKMLEPAVLFRGARFAFAQLVLHRSLWNSAPAPGKGTGCPGPGAATPTAHRPTPSTQAPTQSSLATPGG